MRALLDTNVLLDHFLAREPFAKDASALMQAIAEQRFEAYISPITPLNIYYVARKFRDGNGSLELVRSMLASCRIALLDYAVLNTALHLPLNNYEDATQLASAQAEGLDAIVTRDPKDFVGASLPVFSPASFLLELSRQAGV